MQFTLCAAALLLVMCLLALAVFGVARAVLEEKDSSLSGENPDDGDTEQSDDGNQNLPAQSGEPTGDEPIGGDGTTPVNASSAVLGESEDMGQSYIDSMVFFGESTTAHLRSRGVLTGGTATTQVWADASNTMMLSLEILRNKIIYPETGEQMTIEQAVAQKKPKYMVLAFGVNGLSGFVGNERLYAASYAKLIGAIKAASPETTVILQTVYPVGQSYSDADAVNQKIRQLNEWLPKIAEDNGAYLVDTASCLKDAAGTLRVEFAQSDGLHLTAAAYREILNYLRTHGCP
ncbi:MAG: SGNH/GDSL hydrolase family protein [Clostridia bacterium]|nr:SGNH/GDSL hydrolase family protein [Clostridia bacterium]